MKKSLLSILSITGLLSLSAQTDNPVVNGWQITDGTLASYTYYPNPQSPTNAQFVQMTDTADVLKVCYDNTYSYINCNILASYEMGPWEGNPNLPAANNSTFKFPLNPQEENGAKTVQPATGALGLAVNGIVLYGLSDARSYDPNSGQNSGMGAGDWNSNAWITEGETMGPDGGGHAQQQGEYHYHATPGKLYTDPSTAHSPIIGYAFDGYPIYGPFGYSDPNDAGSSIVRIESSWQLRTMADRTTYSDGSTAPTAGPNINSTFPIGTYIEDYEYVSSLGDLDEYNGRFCKTPEYPNGTYAYFVTTDNNGDPAFPYLIGLEYYGVISASSTGVMAGNNTIPGSATCFDIDTPIPSTVVELINNSNGSLTVYPNPVNDKLNIQSSFEGQNTISIYNALGQPIKVDVANSKNYTISMESLIPGTYFIVVSNGTQTETTRIIKK